jgi:hypothetical protein
LAQGWFSEDGTLLITINFPAGKHKQQVNSEELAMAEENFKASPNEKLHKVFNKALLVALCTSRLQQPTQVLEAKTKRELAELLISWVSSITYSISMLMLTQSCIRTASQFRVDRSIWKRHPGSYTTEAEVIEEEEDCRPWTRCSD